MSDTTAEIFIECKTKKVRHRAKVGLLSTEILQEDLEKMADFIVQTYKTLCDALNGKYGHWKSSGKPIYALIVTLEEWLTFGVTEIIDDAASRKLVKSGIDLDILIRHPYTICSVEDLETAIQIIEKVGIEPFFSKKATCECRKWDIDPFMRDVFKAEVANVRSDLFADDWQRIHQVLGVIK